MNTLELKQKVKVGSLEDHMPQEVDSWLISMQDSCIPVGIEPHGLPEPTTLGQNIDRRSAQIIWTPVRY